MLPKLRIVYLAHSFRSDWNNGNAHFLRGLMRALIAVGHDVMLLEPEHEWSVDNLRNEARGEESLTRFRGLYPDLRPQTYTAEDEDAVWLQTLEGADVVIFHEWNPPQLAQQLLRLRDQLGFRLLFHDTHHRASSSPTQMQQFGLDQFDGILAFGEALRLLYRERFALERVWTLHEAADTSIFKPIPESTRDNDVVWIGNWGEGERAAELRTYLVAPAAELSAHHTFRVYGVRFPQDGLEALAAAGIAYGKYLPNLEAPRVYARSRLTLHIPRQQYTKAMMGIPTIRVFEALACGIPLVSAPWHDVEGLFRKDDFLMVNDTAGMTGAIRDLLADPLAAADRAARGLETVLSRHTCNHRAQELTEICHEVLA